MIQLRMLLKHLKLSTLANFKVRFILHPFLTIVLDLSLIEVYRYFPFMFIVPPPIVNVDVTPDCVVSYGESLILTCTIKWNKPDYDHVKNVVEAVFVEWNGSTAAVDPKQANLLQEQCSDALIFTDTIKIHSVKNREQYSCKVAVIPERSSVTKYVCKPPFSIKFAGMLERLMAHINYYVVVFICMSLISPYLHVLINGSIKNIAINSPPPPSAATACTF